MKKSKILAFAISCSMMLPITTILSDTTNNISISADTTINNISSEEYYEKVNTMISLVNEYRAENGLKPYKVSPLLMDFAQQRAKEQEQTGLSHTRPDGSKWSTIFTQNSVTFTSVRENVGGGTLGYASDPEIMLKNWQSSEGHNANILSDCEYIGIGIDYYDGNCYWVQLFCSSSDENISNGSYEPSATVTTTTTTTTTSATTTTPPTTMTTTTPPTTTTTMTTTTTSNTNDNLICDILILKKYLLGCNVTELSSTLDVNNDGCINILDLLSLKSQLAKDF